MPQDPHESCRRLPRYAKDPGEETFLHAVNKALLSAVLPPLTGNSDPRMLPIVYVVGAPRSGTTLLSQLLSRYLVVGYINNLIARFWLRPSVGIRLSAILLGSDARRAITLDSVHGVTSGLAGPHEFGYFWRHWLNLDASPTHRLDSRTLAEVDQEGLRDALEQEILASFDAPVVFKNVICGLQAAFLSELHPRSLFVHVKRDLYATAASVLTCRLQRYGSYSAWWSLKPSTYASIVTLPNPAAQAVAQVLDSVAEIDQELARPGVNSVTLRYEGLCADPRGVLEQVATALKEMGCTVDTGDEPPPILSTSMPQSLPPELERALQFALAHRRCVVERPGLN